MIHELKDKEIFVFGSNMNGHHAGGAAKQAMDSFGAEWGINEGLTGRCYAFPTLDREMTKRGMRALENSRDRFFATARALPEYTFLLTPVGTGIAGYSVEKMALLFRGAPANVVLPKEFKEAEDE